MAHKPVGERLAEFIGEGPGKRMSIREFATRMARHPSKPRGHTRAMIHRYLTGSEPPLEFTRAAADTLGLNPEWLALGLGSPTAAHAEADAVVSGAESDWERERAGLLLRTVLVEMGLAEHVSQDFIPHWVASLAEVRLRLALGGSYSAHDPLGMRDPRTKAPGGTYVDPIIERDIAAALMGPLIAFNLDPVQIDRDSFGDYITAMVPVLLSLSAERQRQSQDIALREAAGRQEMREVIPKRARTRSSTKSKQKTKTKALTKNKARPKRKE